jgi:carboxypeptidase Taq
MKSYKKLEKKIEEVFRINNIVNALYWDMSTNTPLLSIQNKKEEIAYLKQLSYQKLISEDVGDLIQQATEKKSVLNNWQLENLKEIQRKYDLSVCIDTENQKEYIKNTIECEAAWYGAKENNDFAKIIPYLKNVIISTRNVAQQKKIYYPNKTIYEILIDQYDSGRNISFLKEVYSKIKNQLPSLIQEIQEKQNSENLIPIPISLSIDQQFLLNKKIAKLMGFDFKKGSIDNANHYFCGGSPGDVRLLVKKNSNFLDNMMKVIHEVGHGCAKESA